MTFSRSLNLPRLASILAVATALTALSQATPYYAAPGATGDGLSYMTPGPIGKATSLAAGDTLYLKAGVYELTAPLYPHAGNSSAMVTIQDYGDGEVIIDGSRINKDRGDKNTIGLASYNVLRRVTVRNGVNANVAVWGASHVLIDTVKSTGAWNAGILIGSTTREGTPGNPSTDLPGVTSYVTVQDSIVYNCCQINAARNATRWTPALQLYQANNIAVTRCNVYQNYGEGIGFRTVSQSTITDCISNDNYSVEIYMDNSAYITITGSSTDATLSGYYRSGHPAIGLLLACEPITSPDLPLGVTHIYDSGGVYKGSPGRQFYRYNYDSWSDCDWPTSTYPNPTSCIFTSTYTGLAGFPSVLNITQP